MKTIKITNKQNIHLQGFGVITIEEDLDGRWKIDLFPSEFMNDRDMLLLDTTFGYGGGKYFEKPKPVDRIEEIYKAEPE